MIKKIFKKIIVTILTVEAFLVLKRFKPKIIAITGSVGKTSTKDAIFAALSNNLHIRKNDKSFNSEIGVPLTILGLPNAYNNFGEWVSNIFEGFIVLFKKEYPDWLVLEFGVDRPGDMSFLVKWIKLDIAVFTRFPNVPVHVEYFDSPKDVIEEKKKMLNGLKSDGFVVLNADDEKVLEMKDDLKSKVITYGIDNDADVKATDQQILFDGKSEKILGLNFKLAYKDNSLPITLKGVLGKQHIYPSLAAICCGIVQDISMVDMTQSLGNLEAAPGRMRVLEGINESIVIDDSYNASPVSVEEAVNVLRDMPKNGLKIAVLGDMSEIGRYSAVEHKKIGNLVAEASINYLFTYGKKAEFIAEEAVHSGMKGENVFSFSEQEELRSRLKELIEPNTVILIKGSQVARMEKIVEEVMQKKNEAKNLLVRQDDFWKDN